MEWSDVRPNYNTFCTRERRNIKKEIKKNFYDEVIMVGGNTNVVNIDNANRRTHRINKY